MNLLLAWNSVVLEAIRNVGKLPAPQSIRGGPPQVARSLGIEVVDETTVATRLAEGEKHP